MSVQGPQYDAQNSADRLRQAADEAEAWVAPSCSCRLCATWGKAAALLRAHADLIDGSNFPLNTAGTRSWDARVGDTIKAADALCDVILGGEK